MAAEVVERRFLQFKVQHRPYLGVLSYTVMTMLERVLLYWSHPPITFIHVLAEDVKKEICSTGIGYPVLRNTERGGFYIWSRA